MKQIRGAENGRNSTFENIPKLTVTEEDGTRGFDVGENMVKIEVHLIHGRVAIFLFFYLI